MYISFVVDGDEDSEIPCWVRLTVLDAEQQAQGKNRAEWVKSIHKKGKSKKTWKLINETRLSLSEQETKL